MNYLIQHKVWTSGLNGLAGLTVLFIFSDLLWVYFYCTQLYKENLPKKKPFFKKNKFFKPVTSYVVNSGYSLLVVNLFYKTSLENFQELSKRTEKIKKNNPIKINNKLKNIFYLT